VVNIYEKKGSLGKNDVMVGQSLESIVDFPIETIFVTCDAQRWLRTVDDG